MTNETRAKSPAKNEKRKRSETRQRVGKIQVRVTAEELAEIEEKAQAAGLKPGGFLRAAGLGRKTPRSLPRAPVDRELIGEATRELNRVGNNLNQIARAFNRGESVEGKIIRVAVERYFYAVKTLLAGAGGGDE